jgi:biopolymer transport protein ExbB/TolQ
MANLIRLWNRLTRSPLLWGGALSVGFYSLIELGYLQGEEVDRYLRGHPVEYVSMVLFFVGLATLFFKAIDVLTQLNLLGRALLPAPQAGGDPIEACGDHLASLGKLPAEHQNDFLIVRMRSALEHVQRKGDAATLDEELKYLADADAERLYGSYALMRIIVWAIPILGFLGTVMGITLAIASISPQALEESLPTVTHGLAVAFDTTALALALSMVLMFVQFLVDRAEHRLLDAVDRRVAAELSGRFQQIGAGNDPNVAAVRRIADAVVQSSQKLLERQVDLWQSTIEAAHERWRLLSEGTQNQIETALTTALTRSLKTHAQQIVESSRAAEEANRAHWDRVQHALVQAAEAARGQQAEMARQGEVLGRVIEATGQIATLEEALNRNLESLAGAQNFEETLLSLSAAIQLLSARLGQPARIGAAVSLSKGRAEHSAA